MSTALANPAINTYLKVSNGGCPESFSIVANVGDIQGFSMSGQVVDVTSHSNTDAWRRKIVTLLDGGTLAAKIYFIFNDPGHQALLKLFVNRGTDANNQGTVPVDWQLSVPTAGARTQISFSAFVSDFKFGFPVAGVVEADITLLIVGEPIIPNVND